MQKNSLSVQSLITAHTSSQITAGRSSICDVKINEGVDDIPVSDNSDNVPPAGVSRHTPTPPTHTLLIHCILASIEAF